MAIDTVRELEIMLGEVLEKMTSEDESIKYAREVANFAGKLMKIQSNSMAYCELNGKKQKLPFMER